MKVWEFDVRVEDCKLINEAPHSRLYAESYPLSIQVVYVSMKEFVMQKHVHNRRLVGQRHVAK